jgi:hypothetical protein
MMKKATIYTILVLAVATLWSCRKETSIENGKGQAVDMVAVINGAAWQAIDSTQIASIVFGYINISGSSADNQTINLTLDDSVIGTYILNQSSKSLATYANLDSSAFAYSTNQGSDTSQAGGTVNVISIDPANKTISGIFSFKVFRDMDGSQKNITSGVFYNIPYVTP